MVLPIEPVANGDRPCPLSGDNGRVLFELDRRKIVESLEEYFGRKFPAEIPICNYSVVESRKSGLVYAWPLIPAPDRFYDWCALDPLYYPSSRSEWRQVAEIILAVREANTSDSKLLDVGCGDGRALLFLKEFFQGRLDGVDLSNESADACRKLGFMAFAGDFVELMNRGVLAERSYDWIVSFHCLEHVPDPVAFVRQMTMLLKPGGSLLISTPLSPMSFESDFFDIMNLPPHHMTRWNVKAYTTLAETLGLKLKIHLSRAQPFWRRSLQVFKLKTLGRTFQKLGVKDCFKLAVSSLDLFSVMRKQLNVSLPDVILVRLTIS